MSTKEKNRINKQKLKHSYYRDANNSVPIYKLEATNTQHIIQILKEKPFYKIIHLENSLDPTITAITLDNHHYLINYDCVNSHWYISLIEKNSNKLIKEIYDSEYPKFIEFIKNFNN